MFGAVPGLSTEQQQLGQALLAQWSRVYPLSTILWVRAMGVNVGQRNQSIYLRFEKCFFRFRMAISTLFFFAFYF